MQQSLASSLQAMASVDPALLSEAINKVYQIKSCIGTALQLCPDIEDSESAVTESALDCLEQAQQHIQQLQQVAPQLQQIAASLAHQQPQPPGTPTPLAAADDDGWLSGTQQQAGTAALALQHQVQAAMCSPSSAGAAAALQSKRQRQYYGHLPLLQVIERIRRITPSVQLCLFKSSTNQMCFTTAGKKAEYNPEPDVAKCHTWVDEVRLVCPGVFAASIALAAPGRLDPVRLCVDSFDKASSIDAWASSKHQVFKRISNLSVRAMQHFQKVELAHSMLEAPSTARASSAMAAGGTATASSSSRSAAGIALECLLLWLLCYDDLFSRPCDVSGKLIAWEPATAIPLPPVLRPYWLSLEQLTEVAKDRTKRKAYHTHLAPWPVPDQQQAAAAAAAGVSVQQPQNGSDSTPLAGAQQQQQQQQQQWRQQQQPIWGSFEFDDRIAAGLPAVLMTCSWHSSRTSWPDDIC